LLFDCSPDLLTPHCPSRDTRVRVAATEPRFAL
jgi:hypothetical protein